MDLGFDEIYFGIKKAVEVEKKKQFINVQGKNSTFSKFILSSLEKFRKMLSRQDKLKLDSLILSFETYEFDSLDFRMKAVDKLIETFVEYKKIKDKKENLIKKQNLELDKIKTKDDPLNETDVCFIKGVGPHISEIFKKIGIRTVKDLIEYYPKRYIDYEGLTRIKDLEIGSNVTITGVITNVTIYESKRGLTVHTITISDGTGKILINFFYKVKNKKMINFYREKYPLSSVILAIGTVKKDNFKGKLTLDKPEIQILGDGIEDDSELEMADGRIIPVYSLTENLNSGVLVKAIKNALNKFDEFLIDNLPNEIIQKRNLLNYKDAINKIHFPKNGEELVAARTRLVYEELFIMQLNLAILREETKKLNSISLEIKKGGLVERFVQSLPFELTNGQKEAFKEILADIKSPHPMQRLLQGDVGSGKTVVACMVLLAAIENGCQGAIMAPTEILASQHYKNFIHWLLPMNVSVGLFLGKNSAKIRKEMLANLKNGQMDIAVGTHALIQNEVEFNNLGVVVIDEQHRFGVNQRLRLFSKGKSPQTLTMTATPIPRTLALTVHGDLDVTTIDEMPKGRVPIITNLVNGTKRREVYEKIEQEILKGHQAYIVYPLIDESETITAKCATEEAIKLQAGYFKNYKVGLLHGKLSGIEKDKVMADFKNKLYDILVCTTVVEVGVDVPNATIIVIENAERFGLSQLHQLRGRVGRSNIQSYCILITGKATKQTRDKLSVLEQTNNGFIVAQKDLEIRGPGEFMGTRQSGIPELSLFDFSKDIKILEMARFDAFEFAKNNNINDFPNLKKMLVEKNLFKS